MLWDPVRSLWVQSTPEEIVRQRWIQRMIGPLGFPRGLLAVEKDLASVSKSLTVRDDPNRRIDILCFTPGGDGLIPLVLIECKAGSISLAAERQALGYNEAVKAPFVCLVNPSDAKTLWRVQGEKTSSVPFLPTYAQLRGAL